MTAKPLAPANSLSAAAASDGVPFVAGIDPAAEPEAYADAARADALVLDLARALARVDAARDHRSGGFAE